MHKRSAPGKDLQNSFEEIVNDVSSNDTSTDGAEDETSALAADETLVRKRSPANVTCAGVF